MPYVPTQKERDDHNVTHCHYRNWCSHCVAGKAHDPAHQKNTPDEEQALVIEFDYNFVGDSTEDQNVTMLVAVVSAHGSLTGPMAQKKGSSDEYVMHAMLNWIAQLGVPRLRSSVTKSRRPSSLCVLWLQDASRHSSPRKRIPKAAMAALAVAGVSM